MFTRSISDAFISASIQMLLERIVSYLLRKKDSSDLDGLLVRLRTTASSLTSVLDRWRGAAEETPAEVEAWLDRVQEAVFDTEDLLDEIETEKTEHDESKAKRPRLLGFFSSNDSDAEERVGRLVERLEEMAKQKEEVLLPLREGVGEEEEKPRRRLASTSLVDESEVYGREEEKESLVEFLLEDYSENVGVVPIVGMGGVGKTTLAQAVFNDRRVDEHFQVKEWVCVSEDFDICRVTSTILDPGSSSSTSDLNSLQVRLKEKLAGKKFLIEGEWERVAESDLWELSGVQSSILPALKLSYYYLPAPLKRCFAYCSIFPKGHEFDRDELVLLWMAEDLLEQNNRRIEDVGGEYFSELVSRSFFEKSRKSVFVMHDLLVDLAKSVSKKYCFLSETSGSFDEASAVRARHFAYVPKRHYPYERFGSVLEAARLRTFLPVESKFSCTNISDEVVENLFSKLRRLRVLSLSGYQNIERLPNSISDLKHLRYLNLSSTSIARLPESISALYNLQTLKLACCFRLAELPEDFHRLVNLRHLDLSSSGLKELPESMTRLSNIQILKLSRCRFLTKLPEEFRRLVNLRRLEVEGSGLEGMPVQICELKSLETLSTFVVGSKENSAEIGELGGLNGLRGTFHIKNLQNVKKPNDVLEAGMREKKYLDGLRLEWANKRSGVSKHDREVLDFLLPNTNLKNLEFVCYGDSEFPNWLGHRSFRNMVEMCLSNCAHCLTLPPLGQLPSLKNLQIRGLDSVVRVGPEFYGENSPKEKPFASLEVLEIKRMRMWKEWSTSVRDSEAFPKLRKLCIESCNSLTGALPIFLPSLKELTVSMCDRLVPSLPAMPNVAKIELKMCQNLSRVIEPHVLETFTRLQNLEISADSLSIRLKCLPVSMKTLKIQSFQSLEFEIQEPTNSLEELSIECSDEGSFAPGFTLGSFPNIRILRLGGCQNLPSLWPSSPSKSLSVLEIAYCHDPELFPKNALPLPSLTSFAARNCVRLKNLSGDLSILAPSLESLAVKNCPAMETFSGSGPLPETLRWLTLEDCDELMASRGDWNLRGLGRLTELTVGGCESEDMASFPDRWLVLPVAITELNLWYLECLETLDTRGLRRLVSLKQLFVYDCPNLAGMTDGAPLPTGLESLRVNGCPLLQENCRKGTGKYWDNISHVPWISFDYKLVS